MMDTNTLARVLSDLSEATVTLRRENQIIQERKQNLSAEIQSAQIQLTQQSEIIIHETMKKIEVIS